MHTTRLKCSAVHATTDHMEILDWMLVHRRNQVQREMEGVRRENVQNMPQGCCFFFFFFFQIVCDGEEDQASLARDSMPNCDLTSLLPMCYRTSKKQTNFSISDTDECREKGPHSDGPVIIYNMYVSYTVIFLILVSM